MNLYRDGGKVYLKSGDVARELWHYIKSLEQKIDPDSELVMLANDYETIMQAEALFAEVNDDKPN